MTARYCHTFTHITEEKTYPSFYFFRITLSNFATCFVFTHSNYANFPMNDKSSLTLKSSGKTVTTVVLLLSILFVFIILGLTYTLRSRYSKRKNNNRHQTGRLNNEYVYSELSIKNQCDPN
jgi:preprotein translocase subunit SecG